MKYIYRLFPGYKKQTSSYHVNTIQSDVLIINSTSLLIIIVKFTLHSLRLPELNASFPINIYFSMINIQVLNVVASCRPTLQLESHIGDDYDIGNCMESARCCRSHTTCHVCAPSCILVDNFHTH